MRVEVQQESDVHFGAWFEATVYGHKAPDKLRVEYEELCEDDAEAEDVADLPGLKRDEIAKRVRPLPPQPADGRWLGALSVGDLVQLSYIGGWWDVKVLEVRPQPLFDEPQWIVKSVDFEAVHTVDAAVLRPHAQWDGVSKAWRTPAAGGTGPPNADMGASPGATPMEPPPPPQQQQGFQQHLQQQQQLLQQQQQLLQQQQQLLQHQHQHQHQQEEARAEAMQREAATRAAAQQQHQAKRAAEAEAARVLRAEENRKREEEKTVKKEEEKKRKAEEKQAEKDMKKQRKLGGGGASSASTAVATVISVSDVISDAAECQRTDAGGAEGAAVQIVAAAIVSAQ
jgi:DNA segregation ATPase FtsK/SpoIIIE-like protein